MVIFKNNKKLGNFGLESRYFLPIRRPGNDANVVRIVVRDPAAL